MKRSLPRLRDAERSRAAIVEAACREFIEKGYDGTRVGDIAKQAGVHQSLLYHYFPSKGVLYASVYREALTPYYDLLDALVEDPSLELNWIERLITLYFEFLRANPGLARLKAWEFVARRLEPAPEDMERLVRLWTQVQSRLKLLEQGGVIREGVDHVGLMLSITSLIDYWHMGAAAWMPPEIPPEERHRLRLEQILDMVRHCLQPVPGSIP